MSAKENLYFIGLVPPEEIRAKVHALKLEMAERFESKHALKSPPHLTLYMPFKWKADQAQVLYDSLSRFSMDCQSFELELKNFGCFSPKVIYVDVVVNQALRNLHKHLLSWLSKHLDIYDKREWSRSYSPHMTIAHRDLKQQHFHGAWQEFQQRELAHIYKVESMILLKHNGKHWEEYKEFFFKA